MSDLAYREFALNMNCPACIAIKAWRDEHSHLHIVDRTKIRFYTYSHASVSFIMKHKSHIDIYLKNGKVHAESKKTPFQTPESIAASSGAIRSGVT